MAAHTAAIAAEGERQNPEMLHSETEGAAAVIGKQ
jgi:hypothetical protein